VSCRQIVTAVEVDMMTRELSRWGVGPSIVVSAGAYAAVAGLATWLWPDVCLVTVVPNTVFLIAGIALLVIGVPMLVVAGRAATIAYNSDKLATTGIFWLTRNPIYSAWIVFIIPGMVLMSRSWPLFLTPVVAYSIFKVRIGRENEYLEKRFGDDYRTYKAQVNELVPFPRRK
jgi:protein-S-isoprenylcysteine O-methyltransferase Ste14